MQQCQQRLQRHCLSCYCYYWNDDCRVENNYYYWYYCCTKCWLLASEENVLRQIWQHILLQLPAAVVVELVVEEVAVGEVVDHNSLVEAVLAVVNNRIAIAVVAAAAVDDEDILPSFQD